MVVSSRHFRRLGLALALIALLANLPGCVQRRMTIRSNPPGALVYVDDYEIGTTPVSTDFVYYGTRKIRLVKDGYETATVYQPMPAPWYQLFGLDFISENFWPGEIRDERAYDYQMQPAVSVPSEQLLGRAEQLRSASRAMPATAVQESVTPPPGAIVAPPAGEILPPPQSLPPPQMIAPPAGSMPSFPPQGGFSPGGAVPIAPENSPLPAPSVSPPGNMPGSAPPFGPPPAAPSNTPGVYPGPAAPPGWRPVTSSDQQNVWR